jgi:hypothetical protein
MKNFPKKFNLIIFGQKTPVKVTKELPEHLAGLYRTREKDILISDGQTKDDAIMTMLHEMTHAVFRRAGLSQSIDHDLEEVVAEQISIAIHENFNLSLKKKK